MEPLTVFNIMQANVRLIARTRDPVRTGVGIAIQPSDDFETTPSRFDVVLVPSGLMGTIDAMKRSKLAVLFRAR